MLLLNRCLFLSLLVLFSTRHWYFAFLPAVGAAALSSSTPATPDLNPSSDLDSTESYDEEPFPLGDLLTEKVPHDFFSEWRQILRRSWSILMQGDADFQSRVQQLLAPRPMTLPLVLPPPSSHPPPPTNRSSRYESSTTSPALEPPESNITLSLLATTTPWVRRFLADRQCDVLLPVPADYIQDPFNLVHLGPVVEMVRDRLQKRHEAFSSASGRPKMSDQCNQTTHVDTPKFRRALARILAQVDSGIDDSEDSPSSDADELDEPRTTPGVPSAIQSMVEEETATILYLLIHQRFVLSPRGMELVRRMLVRPAGSTTDLHPIFGQCPRRSCQGTAWLPHGARNDPAIVCKFGQASTSSHALAAPVLPVDYRCHRYCPSCRETFYCWDSVTDGCAWGTSFAMLFLLTFGDELFPTWRHQQTIPPPVTRNANPLPLKELMDHNECQIDEALPRVFGFPLLVGSSCKKS
jgi:Casein kinase II regulatory subunit